MANTLMRQALIILKKYKIPMVFTGTKQKSTKSNILTSVYKDVPVSNLTINDFVWQNLDKWPNKFATVSNINYSLLSCIHHHSSFWGITK